MYVLRLALLSAVIGLGSLNAANALTIDLGFIQINIGGGWWPGRGGGGGGGGHGGEDHGGGDDNNGAPAPVAAAGLPLLAAFAAYKAFKWHRRR
ncbi:hypothetical protein [Azorhizobium doebereinerae]|uniref:hypothetical protein n=1 Tax=Azorhizobium doebereinerae TaxID=281091 RepID=UPI0003FBA330|nr:hypothetical protein [Azorhizobium doebereinerae]